MTIANVDVIFYTLTFIAPGFIMDWTISLFIPRKSEDSKVSFIRFLTLSSLNFALWSWLMLLIDRVDIFSQHVGLTALSWFIIIFVSPVLFGLLAGHFSQKGIFHSALNSLGLSPMHLSPTAWDWVFSQIDSESWLIVTLKDGVHFAGLFAGGSLSSSTPNERDIYLEAVYTISDSGAWKKFERTAGVLIKADQIRYVEFLEG